MSNAKQVALVTGCSSGFGKLIALKLARNGFAVFASMREIKGRNAQAAAVEKLDATMLLGRSDPRGGKQPEVMRELADLVGQAARWLGCEPV